jgi:hypothetical protein
VKSISAIGRFANRPYEISFDATLIILVSEKRGQAVELRDEEIALRGQLGE